MGISVDPKPSMPAHATQHCAGCGAADPQPFFSLPAAPVDVGSLPPSAEAAQQARRAAIRLVGCQACGLIQNQLYDVGCIGFQPGYEVSLFYSPTFRDYIEGVGHRLIERYRLRQKRVLEIGCGGGEFLRLLCEAGRNEGVGIDPTIAQPSVEKVGQGTVRFVRILFQDACPLHRRLCLLPFGF